MLGGGGFTGGVYEIGALRALDLLAVNSTVNEFDIYVGTSAGAFIAALCANGVTPEEMMRVATREGPLPFRDIDLGDLLRPNLGELARKGALLPLRDRLLGRQFVCQLGQVSLMDLVAGLAQALPSGLYTGAGIEGYLRRSSSEPDRTNDFRELGGELYITATDLDTCERVVFGAKGTRTCPISTAVRASGALPMVYAPVHVEGRELVDGGLVSTTNLDIAVRSRRQARRRRQPPRALRQRLRRARPHPARPPPAPRLGHGLSPDRLPGLQDARLPAPARDGLPLGGALPRRGHPADRARPHRRADVPDLDDELHLPHRDRPPRLPVRHLPPARRVRPLQGRRARHGIDISAARVRNVVDHFETDQEEASAWRRILEGTTGALLRQTGAARGRRS